MSDQCWEHGGLGPVTRTSEGYKMRTSRQCNILLPSQHLQICQCKIKSKMRHGNQTLSASFLCGPEK